MEVLLSWCGDGCYFAISVAGQQLRCPVAELSGAWTVRFSVRSDASLVGVEGRDVKHVAVCANSDGFHLTVSGQRSWMRGAARAKDLKQQSIYIIRYHIYYKYGQSAIRSFDYWLIRLISQNTPSHSFYSGASCEWQWKELCRQYKSCRLHRAPNLEDLQWANNTQLTPLGPVISHHSVCFKENEPVILMQLWEGWLWVVWPSNCPSRALAATSDEEMASWQRTQSSSTALRWTGPAEHHRKSNNRQCCTRLARVLILAWVCFIPYLSFAYHYRLAQSWLPWLRTES